MPAYFKEIFFLMVALKKNKYKYEEIKNKFIIILSYLHDYLTEWVSLSVRK